MVPQVLANGEEVRLQRNALQIVALPIHGDTDFSDMDDDDTTVFPAGDSLPLPRHKQVIISCLV